MSAQVTFQALVIATVDRVTCWGSEQQFGLNRQIHESAVGNKPADVNVDVGVPYGDLTTSCRHLGAARILRSSTATREVLLLGANCGRTSDFAGSCY